MNDAIILIYDVSHNGIICSARSYTHANAIASGLINGRIKSWYRKERLDFDYDFDNANVHYCLTKNNIGFLDEKFATKEWRDFRAMMYNKVYCLEYWEFRCKKLLSRHQEYFDDSFFAYLASELNKCLPLENVYTDAIYEYADIQKITPESAYQELTMKLESRGILQMRNYATYLKGVRELSQQTTYEDNQATLAKLLGYNNYSVMNLE